MYRFYHTFTRGATEKVKAQDKQINYKARAVTLLFKIKKIVTYNVNLIVVRVETHSLLMSPARARQIQPEPESSGWLKTRMPLDSVN